MRKRSLLTRSFSVATLTFLLAFLPSSVSAHSFQSLNNWRIFQTDSGLYRLRLSSKPWQLVSLPGQTAVSSLVYKNRLYLISQANQGQILSVSSDGLSFKQLDLEPSDLVNMRVIGGQLWIMSRRGSNYSLRVNEGSDSLIRLTEPFLRKDDDFNRITSWQDSVVYPAQSGEKVIVYQANNYQWLPMASLDCNNSEVFVAPILSIYCNQDRWLISQTPSTWQLLIQNVLLPKANSSLIIAQDIADNRRLYVWENGELEIIDGLEPPNQKLMKETVLIGKRIFIKDDANSLFELNWRQERPSLTLLSAQSTARLLSPDDQSMVFLIDGDKYLVSKITDSWQSITTEGAFNHVVKTPSGYFVWQTDETKAAGGLAQYSPEDPINFKKVNTWSSTQSPVQAVSLGQELNLLSVITDSGRGNINLYKSSDLTSWSRVTLPTSPTYSLTIDQIRQLATSSLVEVEAPVSVKPGVLGSNIIYIQDETGGIQVYMSTSKGSLPSEMGQVIRVTGEISSSKAKRILVDDGVDISLGEKRGVTKKSLSSNSAKDYLGFVANIEGKIASFGTNSFYLTSSDDQLKVNVSDELATIKDKFLEESRVVVPAVIDVNTANSQVESWYLDEEIELLSLPPSDSSTETTATKLGSQTDKVKSLSTTSKNASSKTGATTPTTTTLAKRTTASPAISNQTQVEGAHANGGLPSSHVILLGIMSLSAGLLSTSGKRFRSLLNRS